MELPWVLASKAVEVEVLSSRQQPQQMHLHRKMVCKVVEGLR